MQFNLYAIFRLLARTKSIQLDLPAGTTARQAVDFLLEQTPELRLQCRDAAGELRPHVHFLINGREVSSLDRGMDTVLAPQDVIDCFPAMSGG